METVENYGEGVPPLEACRIESGRRKNYVYLPLVKPVTLILQRNTPAVVYVYGGPHAHVMVPVSPLNVSGAEKDMSFFVLGQQGIGKSRVLFESVTFRHLGDKKQD